MWLWYSNECRVHAKVIHDLKLYKVEPQLSVPRLSGFLDYPDYFPSPNFVVNFISHDQDPQQYSFKNYSIEKCSQKRVCLVFKEQKQCLHASQLMKNTQTRSWIGSELIGSTCTVGHIVFQVICNSVVSPSNVVLKTGFVVC